MTSARAPSSTAKAVAANARSQALHGPSNRIALASWAICLALVARKTVLVRPRVDTLSIDAHAAAEIGLVGLACLLLVSRPQLLAMIRSLRGTSAGWFLSLCGLGLLSALWSGNPPYSAFQATEVLSQTLLVFLALEYSRGFEATEKRILTVCATVVALGLGMTLKIHGSTFALRHWHANAYPASAAMLACYCFVEYFDATPLRRRRLMAFGGFAAFAVLLGTSSASIVAAAAGVCLAMFLKRGLRWPLAALVMLLILGAVFDPDRAQELLFPGKEGDQVTSFGGRTTMWQEAFRHLTEKPLFGHGFAMGDRLAGGLATNTDRSVLTNTHNALLSIALGTGLMGVLLFALMLLGLLRESLQSAFANCPGAAGVACALFAGLTNSMSIAFLGEDWRDPSLVFVCFLAFHFLIMQRGVYARRATAAVR